MDYKATKPIWMNLGQYTFERNATHGSFGRCDIIRTNGIINSRVLMNFYMAKKNNMLDRESRAIGKVTKR